MDSSPSVLNPLQREVLDALSDEPGAYLSGAAALSAYYLRHRQSHDLDLFTPDRDVVALLGRRLEAEGTRRGWRIERLRSSPGFRRYSVRFAEDQTLVDLVHEPVPQEVPLADKPRHDALRYDALEDLVANKLAALLGRGDVKDLVDLYFLELSDIDVLDSMPAAARKDAGLEPATLAWVLSGMSTDPSRLLLLRPVRADELGRFRDDLVRRLLAGSFPTDEPS